MTRFLRSMTMDVSVMSYRTWSQLCVYMDGSAAVIGEMMLPVLCPEPVDGALAPARALGVAFQMTNFLRDVGEDLDRGRVYIPAEDLRRFGADPSAREVTPEWAELMRFEIARTRAIYRQAADGIERLPRRAAACVRTAAVLYAEILSRIEANRYDVFSRRARVALPIKTRGDRLQLGGCGIAPPPRQAHLLGPGPELWSGAGLRPRGGKVEHYQYLMVLTACIILTLPLEVIAGARVYRRPRSALRAVASVAIPFVAWDAAAARAHMWIYNPVYIIGWRPVLGLPVEELLFFIVVPVCALLTFDAVETLFARVGQRG